MDEFGFQATPVTNPTIGKLAELLRKGKEFGNQYQINKNIPLIGGTQLGDLFLQQKPEEVERYAYGDYPFRNPQDVLGTGGNRLDVFKSNRFDPTFDVASTLIPTGMAAGKAAPAMAKALAPKAAEMTENYLTKIGAINNIVPPSKSANLNNLAIVKEDASNIFGKGSEKIRYTDPNTQSNIQVVVRPDGSASVLNLEVPEKFRKQGIGQKLQEQVLTDFPNMQGQVSSKAAATTAYRLGRRPVGMENASLDDVYKMIDEDSSVNMISPLRQKELNPTRKELLTKQIEDLDYQGSHKAPNYKTYGAPLNDLTQIMPKDVYSSEAKRLYGIGDSVIDSEWRIAALKAKGKPDAEIEIYRAVPKGIKNINTGDWVTTSKKYAKDHGENTLNGDYEIVTKKVKANTLSTEGYPYEFGYHEN